MNICGLDSLKLVDNKRHVHVKVSALSWDVVPVWIGGVIGIQDVFHAIFQDHFIAFNIKNIA